MTILVTGAAGFVGYHVCEQLLARGERVVGIDNMSNYYELDLKKDRLAQLHRQDNFSYIKLDFSHFEALRNALGPLGIKRIIHLGAQVNARHSMTNPFDYIQSNIVGHLNLLEFCRHEDQLDHFVYSSSGNVYGSNKKQPFSEDDPVENPISLYAATKRADELMSQSYAHLYRIPQTGLRIFSAYGPWGRPDMTMWRLTRSILEGQPITLSGGGEMIRDFTYIDDVAAGIIAAMDHPPVEDGKTEHRPGSTAPHRIYNIARGTPESIHHAVEILEEAMGRTAEKVIEEAAATDLPRTHADITAIQRDCGYNPTVTIEEGIPRFVNWYRDYYGF